MKTHLTVDKIQDLFSKQIETALIGDKTLLADIAIQQTVDFFKDFNIVGVNSTNPDKDYLSFDYGFYPWRNSNEKHFIVFLTRHFNPDDNNGVFRYDLYIALHFGNVISSELGSLRINSNKFTTVQKWTDELKNTSGYKAIKTLCSTTYDIELIKHKYGW